MYTIHTVVSNLSVVSNGVLTLKCCPEIGIMKRCKVDLTRAHRITWMCLKTVNTEIDTEAQLLEKVNISCLKLGRFRCRTKLILRP
jgi:hypothetical protein